MRLRPVHPERCHSCWAPGREAMRNLGLGTTTLVLRHWVKANYFAEDTSEDIQPWPVIQERATAATAVQNEQNKQQASRARLYTCRYRDFISSRASLGGWTFSSQSIRPATARPAPRGVACGAQRGGIIRVFSRVDCRTPSLGFGIWGRLLNGLQQNHANTQSPTPLLSGKVSNSYTCAHVARLALAENTILEGTLRNFKGFCMLG